MWNKGSDIKIGMPVCVTLISTNNRATWSKVSSPALTTSLNSSLKDCRWGHHNGRKRYLSAWGLELWIGQSLMSTEGLESLSHLWFSPSGITSNEVCNAVYYARRQFSQQEWRCSSPGVTVCHGNSPIRNACRCHYCHIKHADMGEMGEKGNLIRPVGANSDSWIEVCS